jgi:hypothetical protein
MPDTWIIDITHYLEPDGSLALPAGPARRLAEFLLRIIAAMQHSVGATLRPTHVPCRRRPAHQPCRGIIEAAIGPGPDGFRWFCPVCGDNGVIRNWQAVRWDRIGGTAFADLAAAGLPARIDHRNGSSQPRGTRDGAHGRARRVDHAGTAQTQLFARLGKIVARMDAICVSHLNSEYAELAGVMAATLARMRPSPLLRGDPDIWACGILHALGTVNFLFDKTQSPHLSAEALSAVCNVNASSAAAKARTISKRLDLYPMDPQWCLPSLIPENPLVWMFEIDGFIRDLRTEPRDVQAEAFRRGLIPYIPADHAAAGRTTAAGRNSAAAGRNSAPGCDPATVSASYAAGAVDSRSLLRRRRYGRR